MCSTFDQHHGPLTEWYPLCSNLAYIITPGIHAVPLFPLDPIGGYLASLSAFIIGWFRGFMSCASYILCTPETCFRLVISSFFIRFLPNYWPTGYTCSGLMWDALMPSFRQIFSHQLQLISLGIRSRVLFSTLGFVVINGRFLHYRK